MVGGACRKRWPGRRETKLSRRLIFFRKNVDIMLTIRENTIMIIIINKRVVDSSDQDCTGGMVQTVVIMELKYRDRSSGR